MYREKQSLFDSIRGKAEPTNLSNSKGSSSLEPGSNVQKLGADSNAGPEVPENWITDLFSGGGIFIAILYARIIFARNKLFATWLANQRPAYPISIQPIECPGFLSAHPLCVLNKFSGMTETKGAETLPT
jgi:hypothetical protein